MLIEKKYMCNDQKKNMQNYPACMVTNVLSSAFVIGITMVSMALVKGYKLLRNFCTKSINIFHYGD